MRTLRNMIDFLKGKMDKVIEDIKRMPKVNPRGVNKVSEDSIDTISIEENSENTERRYQHCL